MSKPPLKAITLHRPWAYAVAHLGKPVENRTWACPLPYGSLIAIHAGRKFDKDAADLICDWGYKCPPDEEQPTGIVAIARFMGNITFLDSPWFFGPIGWHLENVVAIPPVPCLGQKGLWNVPTTLLPLERVAFFESLKWRTGA